MGQLIDGVWHDTGTIPNLPAVNFNVQLPHFITGSLPMARQAPLAQAVLSQRKIVIISMFHSPARGRTAR